MASPTSRAYSSPDHPAPIPRHDALDRIGQDDAVITSLLQANLVRSLALRVGVVVLGWCLSRIRQPSGSIQMLR
jgi:hypothetical protein